MNRRRFLAVAAAALAASPARAETLRWRGRALGAEAEITLRGDPASAETALNAARDALETAERQFSLYREDSAISRLNRTGVLERPAPAFRSLIDLADTIHEATDGRFDPTVQPLWRALATGGDARAAATLIGWRRLKRVGAIRLDPGQALTFNGIAQGFAADMVSAALAQNGFAETLVDIGEFKAGSGPWRIGVADPRAGLVRTATLEESAIATSSPRATLVGGGPHILGPAGDAPVWSTVAVEAKSAALADGLSTAFCLMTTAEIEAAMDTLPDTMSATLVDAGGDLRVLRA